MRISDWRFRRVLFRSLRPLAVAQAHALDMPADIAEPDRLEPEDPVLEAEPHAFVEPEAAAEQLDLHQAAGLAIVLVHVLQARIVAGGPRVHLGAEPVHVWERHPALRVGPDRFPAALGAMGEMGVVGTQTN